ncbi:HlyD family secretion protein [Gemmata sp.]|uniref:HlyD family secretion protein n=1 Tax=Gemmata sp. TaxID=1914242 RepID=UPI003F6EF6D0
MLTRYLLPVLAVVAFSFAMIQMTKAQQQPPPVSPPVDPGKSPFGKQVAGAGIVEPETENISVGTHVPGVVRAVHVRVDDRVTPGAPLFELDDRQMAAELTVRQSMRDSAAAQLAKLEAMPRREELPPLEAKVEEAKANVEDKVRLFERAKREIDTGVGSGETFDTRRMSVDVAKAQLRRVEAELDLTRAGAWKFDTAVARATLTQTQAQVDQTKTELERLRVAAPRIRKPGADRTREPIPSSDLLELRVLQVNVRPGEYVGATPGQAIIVLGTVGRLHVRVDIDENDIARFKPGIKGTATPRGEPGTRLPLSFVRVEPYVIPKKSLTGGNTERVDTRVLQVIYAIDVPNPTLYVGQQLDVSLDAGG